MSQTESEIYASSFFSELGFSVAPIPRGASKTPDLLVTPKGERGPNYLVEVKERLDNPTQLEERARLLSTGQVFTLSLPTGYCDVTSKRIKKASRQLGSANESVDFRLVWLHAGGSNPQLQYERALATLYGTRPVLDFQDGSFQRDCLYFGFSEFRRQREHLDGAIVSSDSAITFALNEFSARVGDLRKSPLAVRLEAGLFDPEVHGESEDFVSARKVTLPRHDEEGVLGELRLLLNRPLLQVLSPKCRTAEVALRARKPG